MAAQPAKSSPSNQQMHRGEDNTVAAPAPSKPKEPPSSSTTSTDSPPQPPAKEDEVQQQARDEQKQVTITTTVTPQTLTYFSSATSDSYVSAKQLLNAGNFEEALALIEQASEKTKMAIRTRLALTTNDDEELERAIELHESIAPFFYLYGTTLLYSLEEAKEDGNDNSAMTIASVATAGVREQETSVDTAAASATIENDKQPSTLSSSNQGAAATTTIAANTATQQQQTNNNDEEFAEDIQIAWENLDTARNIIEKMIGEGISLSETDAVKLQL